MGVGEAYIIHICVSAYRHRAADMCFCSGDKVLVARVKGERLVSYYYLFAFWLMGPKCIYDQS